MWIFYSLFFAFWTAVQVVIFKKLSNRLSTPLILFISGGFVLPFIFLIILFQEGIPKVNFEFFKLMFISSLLDITAFIMALEGIRRSSVSLVSPMASFSPVFTTIIAAFTLNEIPPLHKFLGILIVVLGAYLLNASAVRNGLFEPFKKLFSDKGVLLFFFANLLWAITPIFQKKAIFETEPTLPLMASFTGLFLVFLYLTPLIFRKRNEILTGIKIDYKLFLILGIFGALAQFAAYEAFSQANLGYVTSLFKLSGVFGVIGGAIFFKEKNIKEKLIGAVIMLIGTIIVLT